MKIKRAILNIQTKKDLVNEILFFFEKKILRIDSIRNGNKTFIIII